MNELNGILTIAFRDFIKLLRDKPRIISSLIFPILFIGGFGAGARASIGAQVQFDFLTFVFTGVFAQILFQSTASGVIFLIQDRENDFSQEIFVSPVSRYSIVLGKILGETLVSYAQLFGIIIFGLIIGVSLNFVQLLIILIAGIVPCLLGGAFGLIVMANMGNLRSVTQVFPFFIFPQFFLSGIFFPLSNLPPILFILSRLMPMTYAVDFIRSIFYWGSPEYKFVVIYNPLINLIVIGILFTIMLILGTYLFVRNERNR